MQKRLTNKESKRNLESEIERGTNYGMGLRSFRSLRGLGVLGSLGSRTFVARLAVRLTSSPALINFSHSFRSVPLEQNRPVAILGPPDGLGVDFGSRKPCYFEIRRPSHPFGIFFVQEQQNTVKRGTRSTLEILRDETKTTKI